MPTPVGAEVCALQYTRDGGRLMAGTTHGVRWVEAATGRLLGDFLVNPDDWRIECRGLEPGRAVAGHGPVGGDHRPLARPGRVVGSGHGGPARRDPRPARAGPDRGLQPRRTDAVFLRPPASSRRGRCCGTRPRAGGCDRSCASLGRVRVRQAAFHPAGRVLLLACGDGRARSWDVEADSGDRSGPAPRPRAGLSWPALRAAGPPRAYRLPGRHGSALGRADAPAAARGPAA